MIEIILGLSIALLLALGGLGFMIWLYGKQGEKLSALEKVQGAVLEARQVEARVGSLDRKGLEELGKKYKRKPLPGKKKNEK